MKKTFSALLLMAFLVAPALSFGHDCGGGGGKGGKDKGGNDAPAGDTTGYTDDGSGRGIASGGAGGPSVSEQKTILSPESKAYVSCLTAICPNNHSACMAQCVREPNGPISWEAVGYAAPQYQIDVVDGATVEANAVVDLRTNEE